MATESDRLLVEQIRKRDESAWRVLVERYAGRLRSFVHRRVRDEAACDDIVQETLQGFYISLPNFDDKKPLQTYLFTIATYKLTDYLRRQGRHPLQALPSGEGSDLTELQAAHQRRVSSLARSKERRELEANVLAAALGELLQHWRSRGDFHRIKILELLVVRGLKNVAVAKLLGIDEGQVATLRFEAIKKLREMLRDRGVSSELFPELRPEAG